MPAKTGTFECLNPKCRLVGKSFHPVRINQKYCSRRCKNQAQNLRTPVLRVGSATKAPQLPAVTAGDSLSEGQTYAKAPTVPSERLKTQPGAKSPRRKFLVLLWEKDGRFSSTKERGAKAAIRVPQGDMADALRDLVEAGLQGTGRA